MCVYSISFLLVCAITGMTSWSFAVPIITRPPQSAVRNVGGSVDLNCGVSEIYDNYFEWRRYQSPVRGSPSQQIYSMYNNSAFSWASDLRAHRFRRVGQYGLSVRPLMASDGATYECQFYSWNLFKSANVFVIVDVMASTEPEEFNVSSSAVLTCSVTFSGPDLSDQPAGLFPRLSMTLARSVIDDERAPLNYTYQQPMHYLVRTMNYTASASDARAALQCSLSMLSPAYTKTASTTLKILTPAYDVQFSPYVGVYRVNEKITCTAGGYPAPSVSWEPVRSPGASAASSSTGSVLTITDDMVGDNTWRCRAENAIGSTERLHSFTVNAATRPTDPGAPWSSVSTADPSVGQGVGKSSGLSEEAKIGLGVGLGVGLLLLIVVLIIICCCCCRKRRKPADQSTTPEYVSMAGPPTLHPHPTHNNVDGTPPPEYCPRSGEVNRSLDKSGYADLGLGYDAAGTLPHGYPNTAASSEPADASMNRSLRRSPRRANQLTDTAPLGYVNRSFTDDTGVSDRPTRGQPRSSDADDGAGETANGRPGVPTQEPTDWSGGGAISPPGGMEQPAKEHGGLSSGNGGLLSDLPRNTGHGTPDTPPGDRSFEINPPGLDAEDLVPSQPFENTGDPRQERSNKPPAYPASGLYKSPLNWLYPQTKPDQTSRSFENLAAPSAGKGDSRLNRSFDPSSYLPHRSLADSAAGTHQGSAPDVRRGGNAAIHFNTETPAIDV